MQFHPFREQTADWPHHEVVNAAGHSDTQQNNEFNYITTLSTTLDVSLVSFPSEPG